MANQPDTNGTETLEKSLVNPDVAETLENTEECVNGSQDEIVETGDISGSQVTLDNTEECVNGSQDEIVETGDISGSQEPLANPDVAETHPEHDPPTETLDNTEECVDGSQYETVETGDQEHDGSIDEILNSIDFIEDADDHETDERETKTLGEKNDVSLNNKALATKEGTQPEKDTENIEQLQGKINDENKKSTTQTTEIVRKTPIAEDETATNQDKTESIEEIQGSKNEESNEKNQTKTIKVEAAAQSITPQVKMPIRIQSDCLNIRGMPKGTTPKAVKNFIVSTTRNKELNKYCWVNFVDEAKHEFKAQFQTKQVAKQVKKKLEGFVFKGSKLEVLYYDNTENKDAHGHVTDERETNINEESTETKETETLDHSVKPQENKPRIYSRSLQLVGIPKGTPPICVKNFIMNTAGVHKYFWVSYKNDEYIASFETPKDATQIRKKLSGTIFTGSKIGAYFYTETEKSTNKMKNQANASQVKAAKRLRPDDDGTFASDVDVEPKKFKLAEGTTNSQKNVTTTVAKQASATQEKLLNPFAVKRLFWKMRHAYYDQSFGLSKSFLDGLNIRLPLVRTVVVKNIKQNLTEEHYGSLRTIFSLAGYVEDIHIFKSAMMHKQLMVEYDHPVEAVQAVSMFNNQIICGQEVTVELDYKSKRKLFPSGLGSVGPGLGVEGRPLTFVRHHVELQPIKQALRRLKQKINAADPVAKGVFDYPEHNQSDEQQQQRLMNTSEINQFNAQSNAVNASLVQQASGMTQQNSMLSVMNSQMAQGGPMSNEIALLQAQYMTMAQNMGLVPMMVPNTSTTQMQNVAMDQNMPSAGQAPSMFVPNAPIQPAPPAIAHNSGFSGNQHQNPGMSDWKGNQYNHYQPQHHQSQQHQNVAMDQIMPSAGQAPSMFVPNVPIQFPPPAIAHNSGFSVNQHQNPGMSDWKGNQSNHYQPQNHQSQQHQSQQHQSQQYQPQQHQPQQHQPQQHQPQQQDQHGSGAPKSQSQFSSAPVSYKSPFYVKEVVIPNNNEEAPKNSDTLVFSFLPSCVTSQALTIKMNEVGKVLFCELAGPGRAIVRFKQSGDAEKCIKLFHKSKVDGQVIHVKFL